MDRMLGMLSLGCLLGLLLIACGVPVPQSQNGGASQVPTTPEQAQQSVPVAPTSSEGGGQSATAGTSAAPQPVFETPDNRPPEAALPTDVLDRVNGAPPQPPETPDAAPDTSVTPGGESSPAELPSSPTGTP